MGKEKTTMKNLQNLIMKNKLHRFFVAGKNLLSEKMIGEDLETGLVNLKMGWEAGNR